MSSVRDHLKNIVGHQQLGIKMSHSGKKIRALREKSRRKQKEVAAHTEVGRTYVGHVECGHKRPSQNFIRRCVEYFQLSVDEQLELERAAKVDALIETVLGADVPGAPLLAQLIELIAFLEADQIASLQLSVPDAVREKIEKARNGSSDFNQQQL